MSGGPTLPEGLALQRTTNVWDHDTVPAGLLRAHRIAEGVWGRLVVDAGEVALTFEDSGETFIVEADESQAIPPGRPHHVDPSPFASFKVEFYR